jgi:hypothetical protein
VTVSSVVGVVESEVATSSMEAARVSVRFDWLMFQRFSLHTTIFFGKSSKYANLATTFQQIDSFWPITLKSVITFQSNLQED